MEGMLVGWNVGTDEGIWVDRVNGMHDDWALGSGVGRIVDRDVLRLDAPTACFARISDHQKGSA